MKYRKKPVVIEAMLVNASDFNGALPNPSDWFDGPPFSAVPDWLVDAIKAGIVVPVGIDADYAVWDIKTLNGVVRAGPGDWIVRGVKGELYPCAPDIFAATHEAVEEVKEAL
jgi:hypothetical protein